MAAALPPPGAQPPNNPPRLQLERIDRQSDAPAQGPEEAKAAKAKQKVKEEKSEWYPALRDQLAKAKEKNPDAVVVCKYETDDKGVVANVYRHDGEYRIRFKVTWQIYADSTKTNPPLYSSAHQKDGAANPIAGFPRDEDVYIYTKIAVPKDEPGLVPKEASPNDVRNAQMFAYQSAHAYESLMLTALGQGHPNQEKQQEAIAHLTLKNFVALGLYDFKGNSISARDADAGEKLIAWSKVKNVKMLVGPNREETPIPADIATGLEASEKVFRTTFSMELSQKDAYNNLSDGLKRAYDHNKYDSHIYKVTNDDSNESMQRLQELSKEIRDRQIARDELNRALQNPRYAPNRAVLDEVIPAADLAAVQNNADLQRLIERMNLQIQTRQEECKTHESHYKALLVRELPNAISPGKGFHFKDLNDDGKREYAFHVQQQMANIAQRYEAYAQFFTGDNPVEAMNRKYDRPVSPAHQAIINPEPGFFSKAGTSLKKAFSEAPPFFPGFHVGPFPVPIQFGWIAKGVGAVVPERFKLWVKSKQTPDAPALEKAKNLGDPNPPLVGAGERAPGGVDVLSSRENLLMNYVNAYEEMEKMQLEMLRLKTLFSVISEMRPAPGIGDRVSDFFLLSSKEKWDTTLEIMEKRNAFLRGALEEAYLAQAANRPKDAQARKERLEHPPIKNVQPVPPPPAADAGGQGGQQQQQGQPPPGRTVPPAGAS